MTKKDKLCRLARLEQTDATLDRDITQLTEFASRFAATPNAPYREHIGDTTNVLREDIVMASYRREDILRQAPKTKDGLILVPTAVKDDR
jgi:aspartyl/glutamyl-tRNA(Asn/Gln) amidotransferase C subunit